jgi:uncharacterized protein
MFNVLQLWIVDGKFYAIFSMLFGVGFGIQYNKHEKKDASFLTTYRRRLFFLLLFGIAHALFWSGDILMLYALLAFVLVELRRIPVRWLLPISLALLSFFMLTQLVHLLWADPQPALERIAHKNYPDMSANEIIAAFSDGSWGDVFMVNLHNLYWRWLDFLPNGRISRVLGLFVLGFYLARSGYFVHQAFRFRLILVYGVTGVLLTLAAISYQGNIVYWAKDWQDWLAKALVVAAQITMAMCYMSILAWLYHRVFVSRFLIPLSLIGKMAFSNYLMQSVIGVFFFYGIGLGYFATMGLAQLWLMALLVFIAQVVLSSLWLTYFKQGPLEWLWRCLTAGKISPNRKAAI